MRKCRAAIRMTNCNTGSGAIRASSCTLTCDIGCNGSLTVPCNAYGGTFTISGTGRQNQAHLGSSTGYAITDCNTGSGAIRASSCTLTCDAGCNGSLTVPCDANGGTFTISGTGCQDQRAPWQLNWICDNKLQYGIRSHSSKQLHSDL